MQLEVSKYLLNNTPDYMKSNKNEHVAIQGCNHTLHRIPNTSENPNHHQWYGLINVFEIMSGKQIDESSMLKLRNDFIEHRENMEKIKEKIKEK